MVPVALLVSAAVLAGLVVRSPTAQIAGVAGIGLVVAFRSPVAALALSLAGSGIALLFAIAHVDYLYLTLAQSAFLLTACVGVALRPKEAKRAVGNSLQWTFFVLLVVVEALEGLKKLPSSQVAAGARALLLPVLAYYLGRQLSARSWRRLMDLTLLLIVANAVAAAVERSFGISRLVQAGLQYGSQVRAIGTTLRAPGLMVDNFNLGLASACYGAVVVASGLAGLKLARIHYALGLPAAVTCIVLSTARSAVVLFATVALICLVRGAATNAKRSTVLARLGGGVAFVAVPVAFLRFGLSSSSSLHQRFSLWASFLSHGLLTLTGNGMGSAGIATRSRLAGALTSDVVADNYYINFLWQAGIVGCLLLALCALFGDRSRVRQASYRAAAYALITGLAVSFYFTETWEYLSAMLILLPGIAMLHSMALSDNTSGTGDPPHENSRSTSLTSVR